MQIFMPQIYWFDDRNSILAVDVQQISVPRVKTRDVVRRCDRYYKLATVGIQKDVRIWEFCFEIRDDTDVRPLHVDFIANLEGHNSSVNVCKFSPDGQYLATGDTYGFLIVWKYSDEPPPPVINDDFPPNKENWKQDRRLRIRFESDVTCLAWSPDSTMLAAGSRDDSIHVYNVTSGKLQWSLKNFRRFPNGLSWDPRGKYLASLSADRRLDIIDAVKGFRLRNVHAIDGLNCSFNDVSPQPTSTYKIFHDDQLGSFFRQLSFSPCGSFIFAPTGHLELGSSDVFGTYVFKRDQFENLRPCAMYPSKKATMFVACSPIAYKLLPDVKGNVLGLPYRLVFACLTRNAVLFYDSQRTTPIAYVDGIHYDVLTSICWSPDGKVLMVSSQEGYNTFIVFGDHEFGTPTEWPEIPVEEANSQMLKKPRKEKTEKDKEAVGKKKKAPVAAVIPAPNVSATPEKVKDKGTTTSKSKENESPRREPSSPARLSQKPPVKDATPKARDGVSLLKFFSPMSQKKQEEGGKPKKRIATVMIPDDE